MGTESSTPANPGWLQTVLVGRRPRFTAIRILVLVLVSFVLFGFVLVPIRVEGISMLPTYKNHRVNFVNRLAYLFHPPRRGDVVAIRISEQQATYTRQVMYMKRVVGLPDEWVGFRDGQLTINGKVLSESYLKLPCDWTLDPILDGPDEYYVVGDNRSMLPWDHVKGRAPRVKIVGKVLL